MAGWLDNFGKDDNYNDYQTHAPEGFQGDGYSNVGRNSSPAWGGQFQMGGSIPGAVGFSYARTQGAAPSNGKYAKKTKASAEDGIVTTTNETTKPIDKRNIKDVMKLQSMYNTDEVNYVPAVKSLKGLANKDLSPIEQSATNQFVDWYSNPETLKKIKTAGYDPARAKDFIAKDLKTPMILYNQSEFHKVPLQSNEQALFKSPYVLKHEDDPSYPNTGYISYKPAGSDFETQNILGHEKTHSSGFANLLAPSLYKAMGLTLPEKYHGGLEYMNRPEEVYGNFHELRLNLGLKPGEKVDAKTLEQKVINSKIPNNFWQNFSQDPKTGKSDPNRIKKIAKAINTVAHVDSPQQDSSIQTAQNGKKLPTAQLGTLLSNDPKRKEYADKVVQAAEEKIKNNDYVDVPENIKKNQKHAYSCIGGVCTVLKEAGAMSDINWSNTDFALHAKDTGFTANQGWGVKGLENLEPGDIIQYKQNRNEKGKYFPSHSRIYLGKDKEGGYRFFDNNAKSEETFDESILKDWLDPKKGNDVQNAVIFKVNPYDESNPNHLTPEEQQRYADKQSMIKRDSTSKKEYDWKISKNAKDYNPDTSRVMDKFINYANDNDKINELVKQTGKSKEEIQDSLLNVFGELGQENNWSTSKGKGIGSRLENIAESVITSFGKGKGLSVGPGQIKYNSLSPELRKTYGINSPNDLYDLDKVIPLMAATDLQDKQVLNNWGKDDSLSTKLFGLPDNDKEWVEGQGMVSTSGGFQSDDLQKMYSDDSTLSNGVGRYSPYLRNQYSSIANNKVTTGQNDWVPFNEDTQPNFTPADKSVSGKDEMLTQYKRDSGSYPRKVEASWRNNLERNWTPNDKDNIVPLDEVVIKHKNGGSIAQNGKEMQYYQQGLDFKPKSISKNGSWLSKYDKAQTGKQVEYGTPEYREAYNRGEVVTDEGGRSPIQLDEVIVRKKTPAPGFWKQSRDEYLKEHQDDGILGAIGSVATYPLGVAQQAMMYGLTGKVQTPTEGMGIRKGMEGLPGTILNAVADPVMFMGELGKAPELLKSGVRVLGPEEGLIGKVNNFYNEYSPIAKEIITNPKIAIAETKQYIADKILDPIKYAGSRSKVKNIFNSKIKELNNPETFKRLETIGVDPQEFISNLKNTKLEFTNNGSSMVPKLTGNKSFLMFDQNQASKLRSDGYSLSDEAIIDHELGHLMQSNSGIISPTSLDRYSDKLLENTDKNILSSIGENNLEYFTNAKKPNLSKQPTIGAEDWQKTERLPFLRETKRELIEKGFIKDINSPITPEVISNFSQTNSGNRIMSFINKGDYDFKTLSNLLNKTPVIIPGAIGLGAAATMQKQKDGGIIKDDRGQWDHPGEITEIGSNDITMEGVPYDVLGISDTGDTKLMKPGKNYKFKGKKVTEYPMAKNGLRQEQKGLQNLDNLTNFTNYNTKQPGGWLDQY